MPPVKFCLDYQDRTPEYWWDIVFGWLLSWLLTWEEKSNGLEDTESH